MTAFDGAVDTQQTAYVYLGTPCMEVQSDMELGLGLSCHINGCLKGMYWGIIVAILFTNAEWRIVKLHLKRLFIQVLR